MHTEWRGSLIHPPRPRAALELCSLDFPGTQEGEFLLWRDLFYIWVQGAEETVSIRSLNFKKDTLSQPFLY